MGISSHVKVAGVWRDIDSLFIKKDGVWRTAAEAWIREGGSWYKWWPPESPPPVGPNPGTYVLRPSAISLGTTGYAQFSTSFYRGYITSVKARISWTTLSEPGGGVSASGRPSGTGYRSISNSGEWSGRTIDHDMYATAVSQFNAGSAYGFNFSKLAIANVDAQISYVQLVLVTS